MKPIHLLESGIAGTVLALLYWQGLRHFGVGFGGGWITLGLTALALSWLYALPRWARKDTEDHWVWFGRRYHQIELYPVLWPTIFGGAAFIAAVVYLKEPGLRVVFFAGWLFPVIGASTFWGFWNDRHHTHHV